MTGLADAAGTTVVNYTYDSWGKLILSDGTMATTLGVKNPYRYRGYWYDTETELFYVGSRYYDPQIGRWINADDTEVLEFGAYHILGANLFAFCGNNPIMGRDTNGYWNGWWNSVWFVAKALDVIIIAITGGLAVGNIQALKKLLKENARRWVKTLAPKIIKLVGSAVASALSSIFDIALTIFGTSIGDLIARAIDYCDGWWGKPRNNGYLFG